MENPKEVIERFAGGWSSSEEKKNQLQANVALLTTKSNKELTDAIKGLHTGLLAIISGLTKTINNNTDKVITSNEKLSESNERYAWWMKWLTFALVFVGVAQMLISYIK